MADIDWDWLGFAALLLGAAAILWGITNGKIKLELRRTETLQARLARYPASAGAVVIKAQRARALKRMVPAVIVGAPFAVATQFLPAHEVAGMLCERLGVEEAQRWLLRMFFPGLPALLAVAAAFAVAWAVRVLRGGYAPPLDTVVLHDTIAVAGWRAKLHAWAVLTVMPAAVVALAYLMYGFVQPFDTEAANRQALITPKCPKPFSSKADNS